jgi:hypothetical protein
MIVGVLKYYAGFTNRIHSKGEWPSTLREVEYILASG